MRNPRIVISRTEIMCDLWSPTPLIDDNTLHRERQPLRKTPSKLGPGDFVTRRGLHGMSEGPPPQRPRRRGIIPVHLPGRDRWGKRRFVGALLIAGLLPHAPRPGIGLQACPLSSSSPSFVHRRLPPSTIPAGHRIVATPPSTSGRLGAIRQYASLVEEPDSRRRVMHRAIDRLAYVAEKDNAAERERHARIASTSSCGSTR